MPPLFCDLAPAHFNGLQTPELLLLPAAQRNIAAMQQRADAAGLELWPHVKTHKSLHLARRQLAAGAAGLTASKVEEALVFIGAGLGPLLLAYPIVEQEKAERLLHGARAADIRLRCIVDSPAGAAALQAAAARQGVELEVDIKVDVGLGRCGVPPEGAALCELAGRIRTAANLSLHGLVSHAGHAYAAPDAMAVRDIARTERRLMLQARTLLQKQGLAAASLRLSVGSTPTVLADEELDGLQELRPGNYVFLDRTPLRLGLAQERDVGLAVLASVVSKNAKHLIIDAGSKTLGMDAAPHGLTPPGYEDHGGYGHGLLHWLDLCGAAALPRTVSRLSEEHGFVPRAAAPAFDPPLGARLLIIPNHACVAANLALRYALVDDGAPARFLDVDARGRVR